MFLFGERKRQKHNRTKRKYLRREEKDLRSVSTGQCVAHTNTHTETHHGLVCLSISSSLLILVFLLLLELLEEKFFFNILCVLNILGKFRSNIRCSKPYQLVLDLWTTIVRSPGVCLMVNFRERKREEIENFQGCNEERRIRIEIEMKNNNWREAKVEAKMKQQ